MSYTYKNVLTRSSITLQIIEDVAIYKAELYSSAGNIFQATDVSTEISLKVYKSLVDITDTFTDIVWKRFTFNANDIIEDLEWGKKHNGKKLITVSKEDINEKAKFQCEVYEIIRGERTLVAAETLTIIDVNDLTSSDVPPQNPVNGQIWIDSSVDPAEIKIWDSEKNQWIVISSVDPQVRNFIRNSNFFTRNFNLWQEVDSVELKEVKHYTGTNWARFKQDTPTLKAKGISQTIKNAKRKSGYTLQVKAARLTEDEVYTGGLVISLYSINKSGERTLIKEDTCLLTPSPKVYHMKIVSLEDTENLEIQFTLEKNKACDFIFTEAMIANTNKLTPWELAPEDVMDAINGKMNHEEIFNALTDNGKIEGIFTQKDDEGNTHFYFNASYIKTGTLKGELIDGKNLVVRRDGDNLETLSINSQGEVSINASHLSIRGDSVATEEDITYKVEIIATNGFIFTNGKISTELIAKVFKGQDDITEQINAERFIWKRSSENQEDDAIWNEENGKGKKSILVTREDVYKRATFFCEILKEKKE